MEGVHKHETDSVNSMETMFQSQNVFILVTVLYRTRKNVCRFQNGTHGLPGLAKNLGAHVRIKHTKYDLI